MASTKLCVALLVLRTGAYQTGERPVLGTQEPPPKVQPRTVSSRGSVAQRTETQAALGVTVKYLSPIHQVVGVNFAERARRKIEHKQDTDDAYWEHKNGKWEFGEWVDGVWKADKSAGDMPPWLKAEMNPATALGASDFTFMGYANLKRVWSSTMTTAYL